MRNLSTLFPWLSIRSKLLIAFAGLSIVPLVFVGGYGIITNVHRMEEIALENLSHDVLTIQRRTTSFLESIESDMRVIRHSALLERFMRTQGVSSHAVEEEELRRIGRELLTFIKTKEIYYQLQMVDEKGDELLRVESLSAEDSSQVYRIVPVRELHRAGESFCHLLTDTLTREQIGFSHADLVNEHQERFSAFSFAMPLVETERHFGFLIANVFAKHLMKVVEGTRHIEPGGRIALVTGDGRYLYRSENNSYPRMVPLSNGADNLAHDYPQHVVAAILSGREGTLTGEDGEIISYAPLFSRRAGTKTTVASSIPLVPPVLLECISRDVIMGPARSSASVFAVFLMLFLGGALGLGLLATQQFTRPIGELWHGAGVIAKGNYRHRIQVETHDEIEKLADQFNAMAGSLEVRDAEIQRHRTQLEEMVTQRTHELLQNAAKLRVILDNVPSAFVLVDRNFHIQMASATFAKVTGSHFKDVRGMDCRVVLSRDGASHDCICRQAFVKGDIESRVDCIDGRKGHERFVEHTAVPVKEDGQITSVLEIITDVTERKRFEDQLLRTERLMAVGEMSSQIAHEFRNSLTSVKMIMQLQKESRRLSRSDKRSLAVALNSIDHMEGIVDEMLRFARPKPMEFRMARLETIIDESLALAQPRINRNTIGVKEVFDRELPPLLLDAPHIKEAFVNILLNAVQACESRGSRKSRAQICIRTKKVRLSGVLRDVSDAHNGEGEKPGREGKGIELKKGLECALVEISDTGCGIERSHLCRIFDPFFTTKTNGTGLGLPLVKRTVNAHGGIIVVKSKKGQGTMLSIYLPLARAKVSHEE